MKVRLFDLTTREETLAWSVDATEAVRHDTTRYVILQEGEAAPEPAAPNVAASEPKGTLSLKAPEPAAPK
jgi:hypothetical protein